MPLRRLRACRCLCSASSFMTTILRLAPAAGSTTRRWSTASALARFVRQLVCRLQGTAWASVSGSYTSRRLTNTTRRISNNDVQHICSKCDEPYAKRSTMSLARPSAAKTTPGTTYATRHGTRPQTPALGQETQQLWSQLTRPLTLSTIASLLHQYRRRSGIADGCACIRTRVTYAERTRRPPWSRRPEHAQLLQTHATHDGSFTACAWASIHAGTRRQSPLTSLITSHATKTTKPRASTWTKWNALRCSVLGHGRSLVIVPLS